MNRSLVFSCPQIQKGAVAVEAALCMSLVFVPLILGTLVLGKFFWYYTAAQKAVHDAAIYMAAAPLSEIKNGGAGTLAVDIMEKEMSDFDRDTSAFPFSACGYKVNNTNIIAYVPCNSGATPVSVQTTVILNITNPFFSPISDSSSSSEVMSVVAHMQIAYVGT
jgi:hypothetical protein